MSPRTALAKTEAHPLVQAEPGRGEQPERPTLLPSCDIYENKDEVLVVADLPGVGAEALDINLRDDELTITARRDLSTDRGTWLAMEYRGCDFRRRFAVPSGIDADKISAELKDGVLWLHLPKSEALKPRSIAVHAG